MNAGKHGFVFVVESALLYITRAVERQIVNRSGMRCKDNPAASEFVFWLFGKHPFSAVLLTE